ncbi:MAG: hypothetical protein N2554_02275 [Fimbriimonadales bacterium]|nr:hypothetical protein [Fimbriimonadales bacterium]
MARASSPVLWLMNPICGTGVFARAVAYEPDMWHGRLRPCYGVLSPRCGTGVFARATVF